MSRDSYTKTRSDTILEIKQKQTNKNVELVFSLVFALYEFLRFLCCDFGSKSLGFEW